MSNRKAGNVRALDIGERINGGGKPAGGPIPFPPSVAEELGRYQQQIRALVDAQMAFLRGALTVLGVTVGPNVNVDLDNFTYTVNADGDGS